VNDEQHTPADDPASDPDDQPTADQLTVEQPAQVEQHGITPAGRVVPGADSEGRPGSCDGNRPDGGGPDTDGFRGRDRAGTQSDQPDQGSTEQPSTGNDAPT
jgi:hypothetical protein